MTLPFSATYPRRHHQNELGRPSHESRPAANVALPLAVARPYAAFGTDTISAALADRPLGGCTIERDAL